MRILAAVLNPIPGIEISTAERGWAAPSFPLLSDLTALPAQSVELLGQPG
ncbi:MAG: hypothetical protein QOE76_2832 [Frankiales bacterium]|nr:hypothetical protein [Frankiales bacterium]